jgi:hypothetical protein
MKPLSAAAQEAMRAALDAGGGEPQPDSES